MSWISAEYRVRILSVKQSTPTLSVTSSYQYYVVKAARNRYEHHQDLDLFVYVTQKTIGDYTYVYHIQHVEHPLRFINKVEVKFTKIIDSNKGGRMRIVITDVENFFEKTFDHHHKERFIKEKGYGHKDPRVLDYRYIEP